MYFLIFANRCIRSRNNLSKATPNRAIENEVGFLCNVFLTPLGVTTDKESLIEDYGNMVNSVAEFEGGGFIDWSVMYNGRFFYYYQLFEGITHLFIIMGCITHLMGAHGIWKNSQLREWSTFYFYECGILIEWIVYGPIYFWAITGAFLFSLSSPNFLVKAISFLFMMMHHWGYAVDSWSAIIVCRCWALGMKGVVKND
ncbi:hypothetical protein TrLO_g8936 [Triparma laevis f. longispina]|nr:hypothetical protein TrLO_g8936 [Triparma laevis f. longispina]